VVLYWILGILVGLVFVAIICLYVYSLIKELPGHRGAHSFEGGPIKNSEREVWGDPSKINAPPRRRKKRQAED
jgi:hypothetical protein